MVRHVSACKTVKTWSETRLKNLLRHKKGQYYARLFRGGKEIWESASDFAVAEARFANERQKHREAGEFQKGSGCINQETTKGKTMGGLRTDRVC